MHKNTSSLGIVFAVINLTIALGCLFAQENKTSQITVVNKRDFETILNALFVAYPIDDGTREEWLTKIQKRDQAAAQLRFLGTNALPLLFDEVKIVGQIGKTNILLAVNRKAEISAAFQVIGPEAKPLVPNLIQELNAGRNPGNSAQALADIGGEEAGTALVRAITNPIPAVRESAAAAIEGFKDNPDIAKSAVKPLLECLNDKVPVLRPIAIDSLGVLGKEPTIVIPVLLQIAETDSDVVLRSAAIKSIGRFGTNALTAQATLHSIAISDNSDFVRKRAAQVSQDLEKEKVKGSLEK